MFVVYKVGKIFVATTKLHLCLWEKRLTKNVPFNSGACIVDAFTAKAFAAIVMEFVISSFLVIQFCMLLYQTDLMWSWCKYCCCDTYGFKDTCKIIFLCLINFLNKKITFDLHILSWRQFCFKTILSANNLFKVMLSRHWWNTITWLFLKYTLYVCKDFFVIFSKTYSANKWVSFDISAYIAFLHNVCKTLEQALKDLD